MQHLRLGLAAMLLTFFVGASLTRHLRLNSGGCFCGTFTCQVVGVIDDPSFALLHPLETIESLWNAAWRGDF